MRYGNKTRSASQVSGWLNGVEGKPWWESFGPIVSTGTASITASSTTHTKGAWVEIISSTTSNTSLIETLFTLFNVADTNTTGLLDIGFGASGSETVVIENIPIGGASTMLHALPLKIPGSTRIAARFQSGVSNATGTVTLNVKDAGSYESAPTSLVTVGANTATSAGVNQNATAGVYAEITSSTSQAFSAVYLAAGLNTNSVNVRTAMLTLATGAASSEVKVQEIAYQRTSTAETFANVLNTLPIMGRGPIPSGTRLSYKYEVIGIAGFGGATAVVLGVPA